MSLSADQVTIAVTVYNRRQYIRQAIASALHQTAPVRVIVVEDCGPDPTLEAFVKEEFGSKIQYIRNKRRRGLFGNWNACLELCQTEWLSILHDDDFLGENYVQAMVDLEKSAPGRALYFGRTVTVDDSGKSVSVPPPLRSGSWERRELKDILYGPFPFPGHLLKIETARQLGGFRETSVFAGDWEMWAKLMADSGAAQTNELVAYFRNHDGEGRGTNIVLRRGLQYPAAYVQIKRVLALMPPHKRIKFDRRLPGYLPLPTRLLMHDAAYWSPRILKYHLGLLKLSHPPHLGYALFRRMARLGGAPLVKTASKMWNRVKIRGKQEMPRLHEGRHLNN